MRPEFRLQCVTLCTLALAFLALVAQEPLTVKAFSTSGSLTTEAADLTQINLSNILQHVRFLSGLGSRVVGYDGFFEAARYVRSYWSSIGLEVREEPFRLATPLVERSFVTIQNLEGSKATFEAYPLWPNHVNPSPYRSPAKGDKLVYVDRGLPEDFEGIDPEGSFVLMEFNHRWYWKNAALFGAKGVIFLEPQDTTGMQSVQKMFSVPINFPRLYVKGETASVLKDLTSKNREVTIWVDSMMAWKEREVANLIAIVEGTDPSLKNEVTVIGAYYDSWSAVPQLSPGATDSMGVAFLLEVSRLLRATPPKRTVWLVAFAGHYQALAGAREFVENHFSKLEVKIKMMMSLDLASDSDTLAVYATGAMYGYYRPQDFVPSYNLWLRRIFEEWLPPLEARTGETFHVIDGIQWARPTWIAAAPPFESFLKYFEAEVFTEACYAGGLGFITTNAFRVYQYTPFDTFERIQPENLRKQATFLWPILYESASMDVYYALYPRRAGALDHGLVTVTLRLAQYNSTTDWFNDFAHKDAIYFVSVGPSMNPVDAVVYAGFSPLASVGASKSVVVQGVTAGLFAAPPVAGPGGRVTGMTLSAPLGFTAVLKPDANGRATLKGVKPLTGIDAQAYILEPETGSITHATDTGPFGTGKKLGSLFGAPSSAAAPTLTPGAGGLGYLIATGAGARSFSVYTTHGSQYIPIFECSSIALLGLFDPLRVEDPRALSVEIYNFISHSYFVWRDTLAVWPEAMVFVEPDVPTEILVRSAGRVIAVMNDASDDHPDGQGYTLRHGETLTLTLLDAIDGIYRLAHARGGFLLARMSANPKMVLHIEAMYKYRQLAEDALRNGDKGRLYSFSIACWQNALNVYNASFDLILDVVRTAIFFFFLSAAFVLLLGKVVSGRVTGTRRMMITVALFLVTNLALSLVHPGYAISSNIWMLVDGLSVILFSILLFYVIVGEFNTAVKSISESILGSHRSDIERGSLLASSLSMGVENLKKRPMRTALTLSTIVITISAMTLFTSMGVMVQSYRAVVGSSAYTGILLKRPLPDAIGSPLAENYLIATKDIASEGLVDFKLNPRAWIYPPGQSMVMVWESKYSAVRGLLGVTAEEARILEYAVVPGQGTTFLPGMTKAVMISKTLAEGLSRDLGIDVKPGTKISLYGIQVTIMGILDEEVASTLLEVDLDQNPIGPPDPLGTSLTGVATPIDVSGLILVPYDFAVEFFNSQPNAISLQSESQILEDGLRKRSFDLVLAMPFDVYYGLKKEDVASRVATRSVYLLSGAENMIVPLFLSSLTILSMMLSAVYERTREISTLSTVGLSPRHIGSIFVMESVALAFLGSFLGYMSGAGITTILWGLMLFPQDLIPNVSSGVVIVVVGVMMGTTMLSSVYPMMKASKLVTPSLIRKWRVGTKPVGDSWSVGLPFNATPDESLGVMNYLREFLEASAAERTGLFMLLAPLGFHYRDEERVLSARLQLSPFDAGIIQDFHVVCRQMAADRYGFEILIKRAMGVENLWITSNKALLDEIRKQFLIWRALDPNEKQRYIKEAKEKWGRQRF